MSKEETIEHLFRMHYGAMFRLAVAMLHDVEEAKDAVSEVLARVFRGNAHLPEDRYMALLAFADSRLTSQTRTVFRLRFDKRLSYKAIAEQTGISEAAVYKHLAKAIRKMKEQFNPNQK